MNTTAMFGPFRRLFNICRKELLVILKDPANRALLLLPALMQSLIFGYAATYDLNHASYALLDQSHSRASTDLVMRVDGSGVFTRVATLSNESQIAPIINSQQALIVIHIGPRFEQLLYEGQAAAIQVILDARNSVTASNAAAYLGGIIEQFNEAWRAQLGVAKSPLTINMRAWFNPTLDTRWSFLPSLVATLSMMQTMLLTALSVAREREQGTFDQLLVTPYTPAEIMIGKSVPCILVGLFQSTVILLISVLWFKIPVAGSLFTLYCGLLMFTLASVGIGMSISALSASMQQAMLYTFVLLMPMVLLSGLTTPVANMPLAMKWLTSVNPLRYAIDLIRRVYLEGVGLGTVLSDIIPLLIISAITLPLAGWLFRNRLA
ncbi:MAG: ABC transporter permease [Steroidobacteraceae bacterium]